MKASDAVSPPSEGRNGPLRILLAAKHPHFPQGGGGLERNTHELCLRLVAHGVIPAVMCNLRAETSVLVVANRMSRTLRPAVRFPGDRSLGYTVYRGWADEDGAVEVASRFKPDVVVAQSAELLPLLESFDGLGIPRMAYFHEVLRARDAKVLADLGIGLIANSEFTARRLKKMADCDPAVVVPLVDPALYRADTQPQRVLFINTKARKGLEIAFRLAEGRPEVDFDFVEAPLMSADEANALRSRAKVAGNITLHPPTRNMRQHYRRARLVLVPSQVEEAWGRVATEAHVNGTPVLASDRGGLPEAVGPGGLLVAHDAPIQSWLEAFSRLWDDPSELDRYSKLARSFSARQDIQPDTIARKFIDTVRDFTEGLPQTAAA